MIRSTDIENKLNGIEQGTFQRVCNEILLLKGYEPYKFTGTVIGTNKTRKGTPDSVFIDKSGKYVYIEATVQQSNLSKKIDGDVSKCLNKIAKNPILKNKISKIIFMHNKTNIEEQTLEELKDKCGCIDFEIYGIEYLSSFLKDEGKDIAISLLAVKDDYNTITELSDQSIEKLAEAINKKKIENYKNNTNEEIKGKISELYKNAAKIINSPAAKLSIADSDKEKLKELYSGLEAFNFYYKDKINKDSEMYYHNLIVIKSAIDVNIGIKAYEEMPEFVKNNNISMHLYSLMLINNEKIDKGLDIAKELYYVKKYDNAFETLVRAHFLSGNYSEVVELLKGKKEENYDLQGFLASMYMISKNFLQQLNENEILRMNNGKFKKMPLYYFCTSKMLFILDKNRKIYQEQFKKGLRYLNKEELLVVDLMCSNGIEIGLGSIVLNYLITNESELIKKYLPAIIRSDFKFSKKQIKYLDKYNTQENDTKDIEIVKAKFLEIKGKEIEAVKYYKEDFIKNNSIYSGSKYILLSKKNSLTIDEKIIDNVANMSSEYSLMLATDASDYMNLKEKAVIYAYRCLYFADKSNNRKNIMNMYWCILSECKKEEKKNDYCCSDTVVTLINEKQKLIYVVEDDRFFYNKDTILNCKIIRSNDEMGIKLIGSVKGDLIKIDNCEYKICDIVDKYTYFTQLAFPYVVNNKSNKIIKSNEPEGAIEQIRMEIIKIAENKNHRLEMYYNNPGLPLSGIIGNNKTIEEYDKLITTLLYDKKMMLYAGMSTKIDFNEGFVIDISSLIVLLRLNIIDKLPEDLLNKIYITQSFKSRLEHYFNNLNSQPDKVNSSLYIDESQNLHLNEVSNIEIIKYWKTANIIISKANVIEYEAEKDELYNNKTENILDKVQIDLIKLANFKRIPLVSDDLGIRRIAKYYNVETTNSISIIDEMKEEYSFYCSLIESFLKVNYLYVFSENTLSNIILGLYDDFNDENKKVFLNLTKSALSNKCTIVSHKMTFQRVIDNSKSLQYLELFGNVYENKLSTFLIEDVQKILNQNNDE